MWSLTEARERARQILKDGIDTVSFHRLVQTYVTYHRERGRNLSPEMRIIEKDLLPRWRDKPAASIRRGDVDNLLTEIVNRRSGKQFAMANRTRFLISSIFNLGIRKELVHQNPCHLLPLEPEQPRERVLTEGEMQTLWPIWADDPEIGEIFQVQLLTGQRRGELCKMEWSQIDTRWWMIPKETAKNKCANLIYLSDPAYSIIEKRRPINDKWVFAEADPEKTYARAQYMLRQYRKRSGILDWRPHDLRRTAATYMASIEVDEQIIERILNHKPKTVTEKHYNLYRYKPQIQDALSRWSSHLLRIVG